MPTRLSEGYGPLYTVFKKKARNLIQLYQLNGCIIFFDMVTVVYTKTWMAARNDIRLMEGLKKHYFDGHRAMSFFKNKRR